ncbi:Prenylated rab acceptor PRA1 [Dillenia turbinata]|uniref:PRA1 family protein n=1 Tax=Dillenia turbinata TaxID=194707 RepID=A0AAN8YXD0_9MAGN
MAGYGPIQRTPNNTTKTYEAGADETEDSTQKKGENNLDIKLVWPLNIPSTAEAAAARIIRNMGNFGLYYTIFVWIGLYISLIPARKVSLVWMVSTSVVACIYLLLLHDFPILQRIIGKSLVLPMFATGIVVELVLTEAAIHLLATLAIGFPIILLHSVFWIEGTSLIRINVWLAMNPSKGRPISQPKPQGLKPMRQRTQPKRSINFVRPFNLPSTPEAAAAAARMGSLGLYDIIGVGWSIHKLDTWG